MAAMGWILTDFLTGKKKSESSVHRRLFTRGGLKHSHFSWEQRPGPLRKR
jgi:hypothetical protein